MPHRFKHSAVGTADNTTQTEVENTNHAWSQESLDLKMRDVIDKIGVEISPKTLQQALVHRYIVWSSKPSNERLARLGMAAISSFAAERIFMKYPSADKAQMKKLESHYTSDGARHNFVLRLGIGKHVLQKIEQDGDEGKRLPEETANSTAMAAIVGAIYHEKGAAAVKEFLERTLFTIDPPLPAKEGPDLSAAEPLTAENRRLEGAQY